MAPILNRLPGLGLAAGAVLAVIIGLLTLTPAPVPYDAKFVSIDKLYHLIAFAALVFPVIATDSRRWIWAAPLAIAYGGAIELIQPYVNRTGTWEDAIANTVGVAIGVWLGRRAHRRLVARLGVPVR